MNVRLFLVLMLFIFLSKNTLATNQFPDILIYNGKEYTLPVYFYETYLEKYFEKHPDKRPNGIISSALWRGYVATYEVRDNKFLLKDIEIEVWKDSTNTSNGLVWKSVIFEVFPDTNHLKMDWVTELLVAPYGELIDSTVFDYKSAYSNYLLFEIDKGDIIHIENFNSKQFENFKSKQFQIFKETSEYKRLLNEETGGEPDMFFDYYLKSHITDYIDKILNNK